MLHQSQEQTYLHLSSMLGNAAEASSRLPSRSPQTYECLSAPPDTYLHPITSHSGSLFSKLNYYESSNCCDLQERPMMEILIPGI